MTMKDDGNIFVFPGAAQSVPLGRRLIPSKLRDGRIAKRLNQSELAEVVGVSRQAISAFEQGEKSPDPERMVRIADVLQQPVSFFISDDPPVFGVSSVRFYRAFGPETKRRNLACDVLGKWFAQAARYFDDLVNYPPVNLPAVCPQQGNGRYSDEEIETVAEECRKAWGLGLGPISNVLGLLETKGVVTCRFEIPDERIEAFSYWNGNRPFIFLASEKESAARARFDAAHELGHLILHRWLGPDELENPKVLKLIEREADRFASAFLLPRRSFPNEVYTPRLDAFVDLKRRWKISIQAMVYRCKDLGIFDEVQVVNLYKQISYRRWRTKEPLDDPNLLPLEQPRLLSKAVELVINAGRKVADEICTDLSLDRQVIEALCNVPDGALRPKAPPEFHPTLK